MFIIGTCFLYLVLLARQNRCVLHFWALVDILSYLFCILINFVGVFFVLWPHQPPFRVKPKLPRVLLLLLIWLVVPGSAAVQYCTRRKKIQLDMKLDNQQKPACPTEGTGVAAGRARGRARERHAQSSPPANEQRKWAPGIWWIMLSYQIKTENPTHIKKKGALRLCSKKC